MRLTSQRGVTAFSRSSWEQENTQIFNMTREHTELPICSCTGTTTAKIQQLIANKVQTLSMQQVQQQAVRAVNMT
jgi:hypothetical protein